MLICEILTNIELTLFPITPESPSMPFKPKEPFLPLNPRFP
jgi:hypothetical protein